MNDSTLPRVTYSNIGADFAPLHAHLDEQIPVFEREQLGRSWSTPFATQAVQAITSPIDPALTLGQFPASSADDVQRALASARNGARLWNQATLEERLAFGERWRAELSRRKYDLALAALFEIGKSRLEAVGEAEEAVDMLEYYPGQLREHQGYAQNMRQLVPHETARSMLKPYGVFAVIAPFNYPVALAIGMTAGALLTGNAVVFKPAPGCALTGLMMAETLRAAGLPEGVFNLVLGGDTVGQQLTHSEAIDGVAFTGSHEVGMGILRHMAGLRHMKPVVAEMGGKNPAYVTRHADLDRAAQGVARSAFGLQGQKCSACSVVYVDEAIKTDFLQRLLAVTAQLPLGDVRQAGTFMGPVYDLAAVQRYQAAVAEARTQGQLLHGGAPMGDPWPANHVQPTIVELPGPGRLSREELFLPFLVVRGFDRLDAALAEGNSVNYGLCAGIYTRDASELEHFLAQAQAGVLYANRASGATTGAWPGAQPFCGWKGTGVSGKGGLGSHYLPQFLREQSQTIMRA